MRLLLDTNAFLWFVLESPKLSGQAAKLIGDPGNDILVSPASYREIAIKVGLSKLDLNTSYEAFMHQGIVGNDFEILAVEPRHTALLTTMPLHHRDPFDRLLIAQGIAEELPIIGADVMFDRYDVLRFW